MEAREGRGVIKSERECPSISLFASAHGEAAKRSLVTPVSVNFLLWSTSAETERDKEALTFFQFLLRVW